MVSDLVVIINLNSMIVINFISVFKLSQLKQYGLQKKSPSKFTTFKMFAFIFFSAELK